MKLTHSAWGRLIALVMAVPPAIAGVQVGPAAPDLGAVSIHSQGCPKTQSVDLPVQVHSLANPRLESLSVSGFRALVFPDTGSTGTRPEGFLVASSFSRILGLPSRMSRVSMLSAMVASRSALGMTSEH